MHNDPQISGRSRKWFHEIRTGFQDSQFTSSGMAREESKKIRK